MGGHESLTGSTWFQGYPRAHLACPHTDTVAAVTCYKARIANIFRPLHHPWLTHFHPSTSLVSARLQHSALAMFYSFWFLCLITKSLYRLLPTSCPEQLQAHLVYPAGSSPFHTWMWVAPFQGSSSTPTSVLVGLCLDDKPSARTGCVFLSVFPSAQCLVILRYSMWKCGGI